MESAYGQIDNFQLNEEQRLCTVIIALVNSKCKITKKEIANTLGLKIRFSQKIKKWLEEYIEHPASILKKKLNAKEDRKKSRDDSFIMRVEAVIDTPSRSIASLDMEFGVNWNTMARFTQEDLRCRS
ncbi:unnamed protein product [Lepeophtheirus salmonis]|uniref:(salmon louse) hypothetical protein n=1 Tax=Lepeophtheirus salmonis TaxID=72036 RepID=A0A7R8CTC3_LEPSM|nr:unnamed protein product [Lepeophtheirus salmonis]CAF2925213.1 unnamed protein product [Lepeophtheirus salmonis]